MTIHRLNKVPEPELASALERFEKQFSYPLGPGRFFRIDHGKDYTRFFRSMGAGACFVAAREGKIQGVISAAVRRLALPEGDECQAVYIGDMKLDAAARNGKTLITLASTLREWVGSRTDKAFAVVMDGTKAMPERYTGRLGIPPFSELAKISVLRLNAGRKPDDSKHDWLASNAVGETCYYRLSAGRYACLGGDPSVRSETKPVWIVEPNGNACGRLEDTRRAKRLIADDGSEMKSAHLSCFAFQTPSAGVGLIRTAFRLASAKNFTHLFVAIPAVEAAMFLKALNTVEIVEAPATVFGTGLAGGTLWNINTSEI